MHPRWVELGSGRVDLLTGQLVRSDGSTVQLATHERELLAALVARSGQDVARADLQVEALGYKPGVATRAIDDAVKRLRRKIELDPGAPVHIVTVRGLGYRFVPLSSPAVPPTSVSAALPASDFVGRAAELELALQLLSQGPGLVTLTGPGGVGKTRLAREVAARQGEALWCDCEPAHDLSRLLDCVAAGLGVAAPSDEPLQRARALGEAASRSGALLVLDNLEQAVEPAAVLLGTWAGLPLAVLATSRSRLRLRKERVLELAPLPRVEAMALFQNRLQLLEPALEAGDEPVLAELVERLDGLPLAIELAAARCSLLGPRELLARSRQLLDLLTVGFRDAPARHATLRTALEVSWRLLSPTQGLALCQCSVFEGGFTLPAAEAVLEVPGERALDLLQALREASLLRVRRAPSGELRFELLVVIRQWARELLAEEAAEATARRHRAFFAREGWARYRAARFFASRAKVAQLEEEIDNLLAAWRSAPDTPEGQRAGTAAAVALFRRGSQDLAAEIVRQTSRARAPEVACAALSLLATISLWGGKPERFALVDRAVATASEIGGALLGEALLSRGVLEHLHRDHAAATETLARAEALARASDAAELLAEIVLWQGSLAVATHQRHQALTCYSAPALARGGDRVIGVARMSEGILRLHEARFAEGLALLEEAIARLEGLEQASQARSLVQAGRAAWHLGQRERPWRDLDQAEHLYRRMGGLAGVHEAALVRATLLLLEDRPQEALPLVPPAERGPLLLLSACLRSLVQARLGLPPDPLPSFERPVHPVQGPLVALVEAWCWGEAGDIELALGAAREAPADIDLVELVMLVEGWRRT